MRYKPVFGCSCALCRQARQATEQRQAQFIIECAIVAVIIAVTWAALRWL